MDKLEMVLKNLVIQRKIDLIIIGVGILLGIFFDWSMMEIIIFSIFIWAIIGPIPSRLLVGPALFFLVFTPVLLMSKREERAEEFAIYAYYFLVMAVITGVIEARKEEENQG